MTSLFVGKNNHGAVPGGVPSQIIKADADTNVQQIDTTMEPKQFDDGLVFSVQDSDATRVLRGVGIVNGVPELYFDPSGKVPALTEEEIATACRLAFEGKRPEFFYIPILPIHPFYGRQYKQYKPEWLKGLSVGETLSEADWSMKCMNIGARSDAAKKSFESWQNSSQLKDLATTLDFPQRKSDGSIIMSCKSVTLKTLENGLIFLAEPKLRIDDETSRNYSNYITRVLPSVAYHDEPLFLKVQEIIKLMLAVEWLKEQGVTMSQKWMEWHTSKPKAEMCLAVKDTDNVSGPLAIISTSTHDVQTIDQIPSCNTAMKKSEQRHCKRVSKINNPSQRQYGYYDHGSCEMVKFNADGTPCQQQDSIRTFTKCTVKINGEQVQDRNLLLNFGIQLPPKPTIDDLHDLKEQVLSQQCHQEVTGNLGPVSVDVSVDKIVQDKSTELKGTLIVQPCHPKTTPRLEIIVVVRITTNDFDMLYKEFDPTTPIWPNIPGICEAVIPKVKSCNELFLQTVPWPRTWVSPSDGPGVLSASGGVTTSRIPVTEERRPMPSEIDRFRSRNYSHIVQAQRPIPQGVNITLANQFEFTSITSKFTGAWPRAKGACPSVAHVFVITNTILQQRWTFYQRQLGQRRHNTTVERYFHGTSLTCNITRTQQLCRDPNCGVCGISSEGLNPKHIQKYISFQRFGSGFYLAPHSSKCHDYTQGAYSYRAMFVCDVLPGEKYQLKKTDQSLQGPPPGFDSIYGQVGQDLNYPEIVLYKPEAVLPRYIILYQKDGTAHPLRK